MKNNTGLLLALFGLGAFALYAKSRSDQGLPLFGGTIAGQGDPRLQANLTGIQGTGYTNPIAAALGGLGAALSKLVGSAVAGSPTRQAPGTGSTRPVLDAGGTYTTGLPPGGDKTHDPFDGFDSYGLWNPDYALQWEAGTWANVPGTGDYGYVLPGELPAGYDDFAGLER